MTTICAVRNGQQVAIAGDGQVTAGEKYIMKGNAQKIHRIFDNRVLSGFAGGVADAVTLQDRFESKLKKYNGDLRRSAVELAQDWRKDQMLQKLEAMLIVADKKDLLLVSGNGEIIQPEFDVLAIGSGGNFAQAAAMGLLENTDLTPEEIVQKSVKIASEIDIFTNSDILVEVLDRNE
ncbi:ATP-dependent protease subunit HslV [Xylocopilactobacillus apicola]|uniref:ATP-dependent protease subunit HslV n=1 Tax=Xylocopilactobacillus apicola TaxID=2932184 RepID=A0AAU9D1P5_9LACO|nr:ATP-dependent protease subunit HslV [Xylocopilactobacillus apicola]BDR58641.1 ATP-dependent protease subunit HslV [Xylocopilactobacillus apicola]